MKKAFATAACAAVLALWSTRAAAGVTISFACESGGQGNEQCKKGAEAWAQKTGNTVNVIQVPNETGDRLALYQQQLAAKCADVDVYMIDVIWPGLIGQHLVDLKKYIPQADVQAHFPAIVQNNTVDGKLVGMPWFTDAGLLYYRTDLLAEVRLANAPRTWDELAAMARKIQDGERAAGNADLPGLRVPGQGLRGPDLRRAGMGRQLRRRHRSSTPSGKVTINNAKAVAALRPPPAGSAPSLPRACHVLRRGGGARRLPGRQRRLHAQLALRLRRWARRRTAPIKGKIGVSALPGGPERAPGRDAGRLAARRQAYSKHPKDAADLVRFLTSAGGAEAARHRGQLQPDHRQPLQGCRTC